MQESLAGDLAAGLTVGVVLIAQVKGFEFYRQPMFSLLTPPGMSSQTSLGVIHLEPCFS